VGRSDAFHPSPPSLRHLLTLLPIALGTQYLQIPGGAVQFLALITGGYICTKFPNLRCITMMVANTICIIGAACLVGLPTDNKWGRLVALW